MQFDKVISGISKYIEHEIYPNMTDWQEILARMAVTRFMTNKDNLKAELIKNPFVRTLGLMDERGEIDVNGLMADLKAQVSAKGKVEIHIPLFGTFSFTNPDLDKMHRMIMEG